MADASAVGGRKLKVFISYSRKDEDFAQELLAGLQLAGFEPYLDKHDIAAGEDWEARLDRLIEAADTVVFVLSPDAVASDRCAWEVERTLDLKKRLLPIVWRRVDEAQVPVRLKQLNYIFFDQPLTFATSLTALATALKTDFDWIREHTRIGEAALRWDARGRVEALLLRGEELAAAKTWLASPPQYAPEPTLLHHEFIKAGEDAEAARSSAERQRLDQMAEAQAERQKAQDERERALRRGQRALTATAGLFACIIVGAIGWYKQDFLKEQYYWRVVMRPSVLAAEQEKEKAAKPGSDFKECANGCPTMIVVPAGKFMMGSREGEKGRTEAEGPQHEVSIAKPFAVGKFDVTFAEWDTCVAAGACPKASDSGWGRDDHPVIYVSWDEAKIYVTWLAKQTGKPYRLLTEAEWEYAARAGSTTVYPWGDEIGKGNANCDGCGSQWDNTQTGAVGQFKPNAFGLYDMYGNVWQWVEDPWHANYDGAPTDGSVWLEGGNVSIRVLRGGSWAILRSSSARPTGTGTTPSCGTSSSASVSRGRLPPDSFPRGSKRATTQLRPPPNRGSTTRVFDAIYRAIVALFSCDEGCPAANPVKARPSDLLPRWSNRRGTFVPHRADFSKTLARSRIEGARCL
jgi:formylglycine-generating enzyme required for sulfatase activity